MAALHNLAEERSGANCYHSISQVGRYLLTTRTQMFSKLADIHLTLAQ